MSTRSRASSIRSTRTARPRACSRSARPGSASPLQLPDLVDLAALGADAGMRCRVAVLASIMERHPPAVRRALNELAALRLLEYRPAPLRRRPAWVRLLGLDLDQLREGVKRALARNPEPATAHYFRPFLLEVLHEETNHATQRSAHRRPGSHPRTGPRPEPAPRAPAIAA